MTPQPKPWYLRPPERWKVFRSAPISSLGVLMAAAFFLFATFGFYGDLKDYGTMPYAVVLVLAAYNGLTAALFLLAVARGSTSFLVGLVVLQFCNSFLLARARHWATMHFALSPVASPTGIHFAANCMFWCIILSYIFFFRYIVHAGRQSIRLQNELELAHQIQKSLVPPVDLRSPAFEIYGRSQPSEQVGGDLVDVIPYASGAVIAYLADITGHGLPASIFMGRVKTAIRTALPGLGCDEPGAGGSATSSATLPRLLERLNSVLPQVKEPNLYLTFSGFRLGPEGSVDYALAASPPVLHWSAQTRTVRRYQQPQLPVGLLPVELFDGHTLSCAPGDLIVVATDGVLEVTGPAGEEFGVERLEAILLQHPTEPLPALFDRILAAAHAFGSQADDQTMLLLRRISPVPDDSASSLA